jgi:hypothetical protein
MNKRKWTLDEEIFLKENYIYKTIKNLSVELGRSEISISSKMNSLNLKKTWSKDEDEILSDKYGKMPFEDYKSLLRNRTYSSILNRATLLKLKSNRIYINYKYRVLHDFFNNINNLNSYWAGFIAADGYIRKGTYGVGIKLSKKDVDHLELFKKTLMTDAPIRNKTNKTATGNILEYSIIELYSRDIINDLFNNFQITPAKSLTLKPPNIDNFENKLSYMAGLIDGDGCIYKNKNNMRIQLIGSFHIIKWVKETLGEIIEIKKNKIYPTHNSFIIQITGSKADKLISIIRNIDIPILKRKWYKYEL